MKKKKINFYETFQLGLEVEGSFIKEKEEVKNTLSQIDGYELVYDGSINSVSDEEHHGEIRTPILKTEKDEKKMIELFREISNNDEFALPNATCGTHIHFSFKGGEDAYNYNHSLAFDSVAFEKYFFVEYFKKFKLQKFAKRLQSTFCKPYIFDDSTLANVELKKYSRDRYFWLNTASLRAGRGLEIRIFPYIQTPEGLETILTFTKKVLVTFYNRKKTQRTIEKINFYFKEAIDKKEIRTEALNEIELMIFSLFKYQTRRKSTLSADSIVYLVELYERKPSAFLENN